MNAPFTPKRGDPPLNLAKFAPAPNSNGAGIVMQPHSCIERWLEKRRKVRSTESVH